MKQFFKFMFASMLGFVLAGVLLIFIVIAMISSAVSSASDGEVVIADHTVLEITLSSTVKERTSRNPLEDLNFNLNQKRDLGLNDILKNIEKAESDDHIKGIFLNLSGVSAGLAQLEEIRTALNHFKSSKKFIYAYSEDYDQASYYLASVADSVYLNPQGSMDWHGLRSELMFMKGALEKLEIEPEVIRHGKFKSAVEPFINDKMSPENRAQISQLIHGIWNYYVAVVSQSRHVDESVFQEAAYNMTVRTPQKAVELKLVDRLAYVDEVQSALKRASGITEKEKVKFIALKKYNKVRGVTKLFSNKKVAVIYAVGDIQSGEGDDNSIGSVKLAATIRKARLDSSIKAIVLRVNSPGGSALASDVIWREMLLAKKAKPVIVSMGDVAASGGYYISCAADTIVCEPNTITGSIGVFGLLFNAQKLLNNKLGLTFDTVKTGRFAGIGSPTHPLTSEERDVVQEEVERIYDTFISHVAEGRNMSKADVDSIGQGRVWSGIDAKRLGLVDVLGGINTAIEIAVKKAHLDEYRIIALPEEEDMIKKLLEDLTDDVSMHVAKENFGAAYDYYGQVHSLLSQQGILARMPFDINVH
ncbi:MAG: signal peptide peptidase SppA [Bacteroidota bacterium]